MPGNQDVYDASGKGTYSANGVTPMFAKPIAQDGVAKKNMASLRPMGGLWNGNQMEDEPMEEETEQMEEGTELDISDYINALFEGQDLSDEFKERAAVIFESALNEKVSLVEQAILEASQEIIQEQTEIIAATLTESIDEYLNYTINEWMEENKLQVEQGFRTEIAENFMQGLKELFENSYVDIPDEKIDIVDELFEENQSLQESLNDLIAQNMALTEEALVNECLSVFLEETNGLADTQIEKLASLSEGIDFDSVDQYREKLRILKESYSDSDSVGSLNSSSVTDTETQSSSGMINEDMNVYVNSISKHLKNHGKK